MNLLMVLGALVSASAAQLLYPLPYAVPAPLAVAVPFIGAFSSQFHAQDELGQFTFATAGDNQARTEVKTLDGVVRGAYSYVDPTSKLISVNYVADANGYRVVGANNLPEAPAVPSVAGPEPVQDTPEVEAAKADFQKKFIEAAAAAEASPDVVSRRRRSAVLYTPIVPAVAKATIKYQTLEAVDAPTPADTKALELKEKESEVVVPLTAPLLTPLATPLVPAKATIKYQTLEAVDAPTPADTKALELKEKESEVVVPLTAPLLTPLATPFAAPLVPTKATIKYQTLEAVDAPTPADTKALELKEKESEVVVPLTAPLASPLLTPLATPIAAPLVPAKATIKYQTLEAVDAPTPADTQKIELKEKESEVVVPYAAAPAPLVIAPSPDVKTAGIHVLSPYQASNIVVL